MDVRVEEDGVHRLATFRQGWKEKGEDEGDGKRNRQAIVSYFSY